MTKLDLKALAGKTAVLLLALLVPALASADTCPTAKPGEGWACVRGGWLPPGHPDIPVPSPLPTGPTVTLGRETYTPPAMVRNDGGFRVGRTYQKTNSPARLYIVALGQASSGVAVFAAECLVEAIPDGCYFPGQGTFILGHANTLGWTEEVQP